jgi:hypothetical protein
LFAFYTASNKSGTLLKLNPFMLFKDVRRGWMGTFAGERSKVVGAP